MKKTAKLGAKKFKHSKHDLETLRMWKYSSVKAKLAWLESALRFGKGKKF